MKPQVHLLWWSSDQVGHKQPKMLFRAMMFKYVHSDKVGINFKFIIKQHKRQRAVPSNM